MYSEINPDSRAKWESAIHLILEDMKKQSGVNHAHQYNLLVMQTSWQLHKFGEALHFAQVVLLVQVHAGVVLCACPMSMHQRALCSFMVY